MNKVDPHGREEQGASLVIVALSVTALMLIVAIVIDLGATRVDRRAGQTAIDSAVASAGKTFAEDDIGLACQAGLAYLSATLNVSPFTFTAGSCATFTAAQCQNTTSREVTARSSNYTVRIQNPVLNDSALMRGASVIGGGEIPLTTSDIEPCDRIGMELLTSGKSFFGGIAGADTRSSSVHAVAALSGEPGELRPINLLILNRTKCDSLLVSGTTTKLVVAMPKDEPNEPGVIGIDSFGTASPSCNGSTAATVSINGGSTPAAGTTILAQGPCPSSTSLDCGRIDVYAPFGDGDCAAPSVESDDIPACNQQNGTITPDVTASPSQYTRARLDYEYNCKASYGPGDAAEAWWNVQPIPGCPFTSTSPPHVDNLLAFAESATTSPPAGWTVLSGSDCNPTSVDHPPGNYIVDCASGSGYKVGETVRFTGGNVIFTGKVDVTGGTLSFNSCAATTPSSCPSSASITWSRGATFNPNEWSPQAAWVYADDLFSVGSANLEFNNTTLFLGSSGSFGQNSDGAGVRWVAPDEGTVDSSAGPFDDLALWTEGTSTHAFRGGGSSYFEGLFFGGLAPFAFSGGNNLTLDEAQFVADTLSFSGGATFTMSPVGSRTKDFPIDPTYSLIR